jgi:hypothetical protein
MKTLITVCWSVVVSADVDPARIDDPKYQDDVRNKAVKYAGECLNQKDGIVTDCEDFPQLAE